MLGFILVAIFMTIPAMMMYYVARNQWVFEERMRMTRLATDIMSEALMTKDLAEAEMILNKADDVLNMLERYSYEEMLYKFWKPVGSYFQYYR
jgi:hypothetical protein